MITNVPRIAIAMTDYDAAVALFRDAFGLPVFDFSPDTVPSLGAHVGMCQPRGGSNIELMSPADPDAPLAQALQRSLDRRGDGFYALMLEAPDPDAEAVELAGRDLAVMDLMKGAGGRDVHPSSTHGVLIRVYPDGSVADRGASAGPPGLSGIMRTIVATADIDAATRTYATGLGLASSGVDLDADRGVRRALCRAPAGGAIELVTPVDSDVAFAKDVAAFLDEGGKGIYAIVLEADDPDAAAAMLASRGADVGGHDGREVAACGARILIAPRSGDGGGAADR